MKKIISAACILTIVLFIFPVSSFAKGGKGGQDSLVCAFDGDITGLEFDFGDGFPLDLGLGLPATITYVEVEASGQESTVLIPPKKFIYNANLSEGWDSGKGKIFANATLDLGENEGIDDVTLEFQFDFATIFERFDIKKKEILTDCTDLLDVTVPKKLDLFFEVTNAQLIGPVSLVNQGDVPPLNLVLVIDKGKLVLVKTFEFVQ